MVPKAILLDSHSFCALKVLLLILLRLWCFFCCSFGIFVCFLRRDDVGQLILMIFNRNKRAVSSGLKFH